jgi:glutathione synthase/RimK-type ligase-like ATP-grasp enzyme
MRPRIALATYARAPHLAPDDQLLHRALIAAGADAEPAVWSSDEVMWETFDAVIVRSCWDYHLRIDEFRDWLDRLDASRIPTWNTPETVLWNSHKSYMLDLASRGVPTIPTRIVDRGSAHEVETIVREEGWTRFVIKPAISASGYETHAFANGLETDARDTIARATAVADTLVQPFAPEIPRDGELSVIFLDGDFSHAAIKRASPTEFRVQTEHGGSVAPIDVSSRTVDQASRVIGALSEVPLYARVDGIVRGDEFLLMELELIEPNLFLELRDGSADVLARAIMRRMAALA